MTFQFEYQRNDNFTEPEESPAIKTYEVYGELQDITQDQPFEKQKLYPIYERTAPSLIDLQSRAKNLNEADFSDFKPEIAARKMNEYLREPFQKLLTTIKQEREISRQAISNLEIRALNFSNPPKPTDIADRLEFNSRLEEVRRLLREKPVSERIEAIESTLAKGDPTFLFSAISSPDEIIPRNTLNKIRMNYAFSENIQLKYALNDAVEIHKAVKTRTGQLSATAIKVLNDKGFDSPISREEFFTYFPPANELEAQRQNRFIAKERDMKSRKENLEAFKNENQGVAM